MNQPFRRGAACILVALASIIDVGVVFACFLTLVALTNRCFMENIVFVCGGSMAKRNPTYTELDEENAAARVSL